jgi:serine/threonine-protein kinase
VIAFECLTGKRPFESETFGGLFNAICVAPLPTPSMVGQVPAGFDAWFAKAVARDREQRWQSIDEAIAQLRVVCGAVGDSGSANLQPKTPSPAPRTSNVALAETAAPASVTIHHRSVLPTKRLIVGLASLVLLVGSAAALLFWRTSSTTPPAVTSATATTTLASSVSLEPTSASAAPRIEAVPIASAREQATSNSAAGAGGTKSQVSSPRVPARTRRPNQPGRSNDEFVGF